MVHGRRVPPCKKKKCSTASAQVSMVLACWCNLLAERTFGMQGDQETKGRTSNKSSGPFPILTSHTTTFVCFFWCQTQPHVLRGHGHKMHRKKTLQRDSYHTFNIHQCFTVINIVRFVFVFGSDSSAASQKSVNRMDLWPPKIPPKKCDFKQIKKSTLRRQKSPKRRKRRSCCMGMDQKKSLICPTMGNLHFQV